MKSKKKKMAAGFSLPASPKKTPVSAKAAKKFVDGGAARKRRETAGERLTLYVPPQLAEDLRVFCARQRRSLSDVGTEALAKLMNHPGRK